MLAGKTRIVGTGALLLLLTSACSAPSDSSFGVGLAQSEQDPSAVDDESADVGEISSEPGDGKAESFDGTVDQPASDGRCSTTIVSGLSAQVVDVLNCLYPGSFAKMPNVANLELEPGAFGYLQTPARDALVSALENRPEEVLHVSSMLRTVVQQYVIYQWYRKGRCGIPLAAKPGRSNHESGLAIDTRDAADWKTTLKDNGFKWFGSKDPVHFDFVDGGLELKGKDVYAFQVLWNVRNPNDRIAEDGTFSTKTSKRLALAPSAGFAGGVDCSELE